MHIDRCKPRHFVSLSTKQIGKPLFLVIAIYIIQMPIFCRRIFRTTHYYVCVTNYRLQTLPASISYRVTCATDPISAMTPPLPLPQTYFTFVETFTVCLRVKLKLRFICDRFHPFDKADLLPRHNTPGKVNGCGMITLKCFWTQNQIVVCWVA